MKSLHVIEKIFSKGYTTGASQKKNVAALIRFYKKSIKLVFMVPTRICHQNVISIIGEDQNKNVYRNKSVLCEKLTSM